MRKTTKTHFVRVFRLMNDPSELGLACTSAGVSLAGVPLLRRTQAGFIPRPVSEIASLLKAAYGDHPIALQSRLDSIAQATACFLLFVGAIIGIVMHRPGV
jgi:hypothetical protein